MIVNEPPKKIVLLTIEEMSKDDGVVQIGHLFKRLNADYEISRVTAGKIIIELYKEGKVGSPKYHYLARNH